MKPRKWSWAAGLAGAVALAPVATAAQGHGAEVRIDQLQPASPFSPFTRAEGPHHRFAGGIEYAFRITTDYAVRPLTVDIVGVEPAPEVETAPVEHALLLHPGAAIAPVWWLNLEFGLPFAVFESGATNRDVRGATVEEGIAGVGDLRFGVHGRPMASESFDLSLGSRIWVPSGSRAAYLSGPEGHFRWEFVFSGAGEHETVVYGCTIGLAPLFLAGRDGDRLALSCATDLRVTATFALGFEPHLALFTYAPEDDRASHAPGFSSETTVKAQFEPLLAARLHFGAIGLGFGVGPGFGGAPGTAAFRALFTVSYRAKAERVEDESGPPDADLDGIPNEFDACPDEAGPDTRRGCPLETDDDGDGVVDGDACPDEPGARYDDPKANGCPDRDNDHVADPVDDCPIEPGTHWTGCPEFARLVGLEGEGPPRFKVTPPIRFARQRTTLSPQNVAAFKEIVATMLANPKLQMLSVSIGSKGSTTRLTDARAKAVLDLFRELHFESNRYEVVLNDQLRAGSVELRIIE